MDTVASAALSAAVSPDASMGGAVSLQISRNNEPVADGTHLSSRMQGRSRLKMFAPRSLARACDGCRKYLE